MDVPTPEDVLTRNELGGAASYGDATLFIGTERKGRVSVIVYPGYRFRGDDRVHGQVGTMYVQVGDTWESIIQKVDAIFAEAVQNYRTCILWRSRDERMRGRRAPRAYEAISAQFRECWHGFAIMLARHGELTKGDAIVFQGDPNTSFLVTYRNSLYTARVYPTGSLLIVTGDHRSAIT